MTNSITVRIKNVYGTDRIYPVCPAAITFAKIAGTITLSASTIKNIKALGFTIEVESNTL